MTQTPCGKESKCWKRPQARIWRGSGRRLSGRDCRSGIEVFIGKLTDQAAVDGIAIGSADLFEVYVVWSAADFFIRSEQDGNRRKNLLRAAELALQFDMQEKAEQYLNEAAEIPGMEEDIFYQQIRKRWEEAG
jgi:hypothetical protein